ncbi:MarR family protein [Pseudonocardia sediminis]|uniref:MarR family protein n=1 Tax=Pseudonocardia sediminis TaxID=1397368 RepID=A0A4Q7UW29_PSEST|nr:MarR family transcriptional regulator [Pseudonocardia sediminis]RZT86036.1 MarR family protein [Pseudonocardia sediminis]
MTDGRQEARERVVQGLRAFAATQSELGRVFARSRRMHTTDAAAAVEILTAEERGEPLTPARLAERIALTPGATSTLLNRLEGAGHILRTRGHSDRRIVTLHTTPAINEAADAFYAPLAERLDAAISGYSEAELALVEEVVDRLHHAMTTSTETIDESMTTDPL